MPLVLRSPFGDASAAMLFLFFLTYGFVGLEVVGLQMMSPFGKQWYDLLQLGSIDTRRNLPFDSGDEVYDLNISGMRDVSWCSVNTYSSPFLAETNLGES